MSAYKDIFETILAKLDAETRLRKRRSPATWIRKERECVRREVNRLRALLERPPISNAAVERAERLAVGHSDYVRKYAHAAADLVLAKEPRA